MSEKQTPILIVDDHKVMREGLVELLKGSSQVRVLSEADCGRQALNLIEAGKEKPRVVLMDINMPDIDGIEATYRITEKYQGQIKVIALTMLKTSGHIKKMLQAGAVGYLLKNCDKKELVNAIKIIDRGETYYSPEVSAEILNEITGQGSDDITISQREKEVLNLIVQDFSNGEIAQKLDISIRTVETHKQNLISKTGANSIAGLVVRAIKNNLVDRF